VLALTSAAGLLLLPAGALADTAPSPSASPAPSPSTLAAPSPTIGALPTGTAGSPAAVSPTAVPALTPSPTARSQALQNKQAQGQLIGDLTASEAHALMLEKSLNQSQVGLMGLGQQILDSERAVSALDARIAEIVRQHEATSNRLQSDRRELATVVRKLYKHQNNFFVSILRAGGFGGFLESVGYSDVVVDRERGLVQAVQADDVALAHAQATMLRSRSKKNEVLANLQLARATLAQEIQGELALQVQLQATIDQALGALDAMQTDTPDAAAQRAKLVRMKTDVVLLQIEQAVWAQENFQRTSHLIAEDPVLNATGKLLTPIPHATITQGFGPTPYAFEAAYAGFPHFHTGRRSRCAAWHPRFRRRGWGGGHGPEHDGRRRQPRWLRQLRDPPARHGAQDPLRAHDADRGQGRRPGQAGAVDRPGRVHRKLDRSAHALRGPDRQQPGGPDADAPNAGPGAGGQRRAGSRAARSSRAPRHRDAAGRAALSRESVRGRGFARFRTGAGCRRQIGGRREPLPEEALPIGVAGIPVL